MQASGRLLQRSNTLGAHSHSLTLRHTQSFSNFLALVCASLSCVRCCCRSKRKGDRKLEKSKNGRKSDKNNDLPDLGSVCVYSFLLRNGGKNEKNSAEQIFQPKTHTAGGTGEGMSRMAQRIWATLATPLQRTWLCADLHHSDVTGPTRPGPLLITAGAGDAISRSIRQPLPVFHPIH